VDEDLIPMTSEAGLAAQDLILGENLFDRSQMALSSLYGMDPKAVMQVITAPSQASPEERRKLSDRMGLTGTWAGTLVDITTNPFVIAGLVLTAFTKLPTASQLQRFKEGAKLHISKSPIGQILEKTAPPSWAYKGTPIPDMMEHGIARAMKVQTKAHDNLLNAWDRYEALSGHKHMPRQTSIRIGGVADGLDDSAHRSWKVLYEAVGGFDKDGKFVSALGLDQATATRLKKRLASSPLGRKLTPTEAENELVQFWRSMSGEHYEEIAKLPNRLEVAEALAAFKGMPLDATDELLQQVAAGFKKEPKYWSHMVKMSQQQQEEKNPELDQIRIRPGGFEANGQGHSQGEPCGGLGPGEEGRPGIGDEAYRWPAAGRRRTRRSTS
jgi:hypothetical protein